jgi:ribosome biogenesis SPOUT family RNA methylase Rps3
MKGRNTTMTPLEELVQQLENGEIHLMDLEIAKASMELDPQQVDWDDYFAVTGALCVAPALKRFRQQEEHE